MRTLKISQHSRAPCIGPVSTQQVGRVSDHLFMVASEGAARWRAVAMPQNLTVIHSRTHIPHTVASIPLHLHSTVPRYTMYCGIVIRLILMVLQPAQLSRYSEGLLAGRRRFVCRQGQEIFLFSEASRPALGLSYPTGTWGYFSGS
jgi:hypothetical protein